MRVTFAATSDVSAAAGIVAFALAGLLSPLEVRCMDAPGAGYPRYALAGRPDA